MHVLLTVHTCTTDTGYTHGAPLLFSGTCTHNTPLQTSTDVVVAVAVLLLLLLQVWQGVQLLGCTLPSLPL